MEALEPYRASLAPRAAGDPEPLGYLAGGEGRAQGIDVQLEVSISSQKMRHEGVVPVRLSSVNATELYWSFAQMVTHHTSNGCNLRTGDLIASGTISGPQPGQQGCLLEMTRRGAEPVQLPTGEERSFLADGDEITFTGFCERERLPRISLGECKGMIIPASLSSRAAG
jgi:fumarylacetoacetase